MSGIINLSDNLKNAISGMGGDSDKARFSSFVVSQMSDIEILNAYRGSSIAKKIIDIPPFDSCREWRTWSGESSQVIAIEAVENSLYLRSKVREALTLARLFGGSAILIGDGSETPEEPLNIESIGIGGLQYLTVLSREKITSGPLNMDAYSSGFGKPEYYYLNASQQASVRVHPSRFALFYGPNVPNFQSHGGDGWGDSVFLALSPELKNLEATAQNIAGLVFEAKIDILKIPDLSQMLEETGKEGEKLFIERIRVANASKGNLATLIMDLNEEYEQKQVRFSTLPDVLDKFMQLVSAGADIPMTRLMGTSPSGMNATGESDIRNYYDRISAIQTLEIQESIKLLDECLVRSSIGSYPLEVNFTWNSLWQVSDKEKADTGKVYSEIMLTMGRMGFAGSESLTDALVDILDRSGIMKGISEIIEAGSFEPKENQNDKSKKDTESE